MSVLRLNLRTMLPILLLVAAFSCITSAQAGTLGKIGKAIAYPIRKTAANTSIDTHRAIGHNSVESRKTPIGHRHRVITPGGHVKPVHHYHHYYHHPS